MWSSNAINQDKKMLQYISSEKSKAIANVKAALGAWEYHQIQEIQDNLRRQRDRVGNAMGLAEQEVKNAFSAPWTTGARPQNGKPPPTYKKYQVIGLQGLWISWTRNRVTYARTKLETYMDRWLQELKDNFASPIVKQAADNSARQGDTTAQRLYQEIEALEEAIRNRSPWTLTL
jgi:hypothetical protein